MPVELVPYITPEYFYHASALAGAGAAFLVILIWSNGL